MVLSMLSIWSPRNRSSTDLKPSEPQKRAEEPVEVSVQPVTEDKEDTGLVDNVDASGMSAPSDVEESSKSAEDNLNTLPSVESMAPDAESTVEPRKSSLMGNVGASGASPIGIAETSHPSVDAAVSSTEPEASTVESVAEPAKLENKPTPTQPRFSFRSLGFFRGPKAEITHEQDANEQQKAKTAAKRDYLSMLSRSADRRAQKNALAVQRLIAGPQTITPKNSKARPAPARVSRTQMTRIKSELMQPKSANRLIAKLRELPAPASEVPSEDGEAKAQVSTSALATTSSTVKAHTSTTGCTFPIHAVCLESTEADVQTKHFSKLSSDQSVISASLDALTSLFAELHIVDLLSAPDLGLGQPGDGKGLLAGAVPSPETVLDGAAKLTPQLMALGFATGKAILPPDHTAIYPPTDRLSVLTYWWGLELCLPPATLKHLEQAPSIAHQVINFLSALSLMYNGVREVLPFVRYIGQFVDFEWAAIEKQDKGRGVVCAATWIMPAAMVPRPWDFPDPPSTMKGGSGAAVNPITPGLGTPSAGQISEGNNPTSNGALPTLVVTPPSVIKDMPVSTQGIPIP